MARHARIAEEELIAWRDLGAYGVALLAALRLHAQPDGRAFPSIDTLANLSGMSVRKARGLLDDAAARGLIEIGSKRIPGRVGRPWNEYRLLAPRAENTSAFSAPGAQNTSAFSAPPAENEANMLQETTEFCAPGAAKQGSNRDREERDPLSADAKRVAHRAEIPEWLRKSKIPRGTDRHELAEAVLRIIGAITGRPPNSARCAANAKEVLALWRSLGHPDLAEFVADAELVARAAQECPHPLFARDVRAEGWEDGVDRSRSVATVMRRARWDERSAVAREWGAPPPPAMTPEDEAILRHGAGSVTGRWFDSVKLLRSGNPADRRDIHAATVDEKPPPMCSGCHRDYEGHGLCGSEAAVP